MIGALGVGLGVVGNGLGGTVGSGGTVGTGGSVGLGVANGVGAAVGEPVGVGVLTGVGVGVMAITIGVPGLFVVDGSVVDTVAIGRSGAGRCVAFWPETTGTAFFRGVSQGLAINFGTTTGAGLATVGFATAAFGFGVTGCTAHRLAVCTGDGTPVAAKATPAARTTAAEATAMTATRLGRGAGGAPGTSPGPFWWSSARPEAEFSGTS